MRRDRLELLLLLAVFAAPILAAQGAFHHWQPSRLDNYGTLLAPVPVEFEAAPAALGEGFDPADLRGRWVLMVAAPGGCDTACRRNLELMRQVRLATGRDRVRIERLLVSTVPPPATLADDGVRRARFKAAPAELARSDGGRHLYLLDPLGRLVLRFPAEADGRRVLKDVQRLLRYSRLG